MNYSVNNKMENDITLSFSNYQALNFIDTLIKVERSNWLTQWESDHSISTDYLDNKVKGLINQKNELKKILNERDKKSNIQLSCKINVV